MPDDVREQRRGDAIALSLSPDSGHLVTAQAARDLGRRLQAAAREGAAVAVLTSADGDFCRGDAGREAAGAEPNASPWGHHGRLLTTVLDLPIPVLAAIDGAATGYGFTLALCADMRLGSETAHFSIGEEDVTPGLAWLLADAAGSATAASVVYGLEQLDAAAAHQRGVLSEVIPAAQLDARLEQIVEALVAQSQAQRSARHRALRSRRHLGRFRDAVRYEARLRDTVR